MRTVMGYDTSKLNLTSQPIAGPKTWDYEDTGGESAATYVGSGWFTDAKDKGADTGDYIVVRDRANNQIYHGYFSTVQDTGATQGTVTFDTD